METQAAIGLAAPRGERTREQDKKRHAKVTRADDTQFGMGRASGGEAGLRASAACPRPCAACNKHTRAWSTHRMAMGEAAAAGTMSAREIDASFASWDICRHACRRMRPSAQRELATSQARRGSTNSGQAGSPGCCVPEAALIFAGRCAVHPAQGCRRSAVAARARPRRREGPACRPCGMLLDLRLATSCLKGYTAHQRTVVNTCPRLQFGPHSVNAVISPKTAAGPGALRLCTEVPLVPVPVPVARRPRRAPAGRGVTVKPEERL